MATIDDLTAIVTTLSNNNADLLAAVNVQKSFIDNAVDQSTGSLAAIRATYYGAFSVDPTIRPDGTAMQKGDRYFDSVINSEKTWNGTIWYVENADAASVSEAAAVAESARDAALIQAGVYTTEALGRAAVADGVAFKVQGSGYVAAYEYRRVSAGVVSTLIATYPSVVAVSRNGYTVNGQLSMKKYNDDGSYTISHPLFRIELGAGRSYIAVAAVTDLVVPSGRTYYVDLTGAAITTTLTGQVTPTDSLSSSYGIGAFVDDLRLALFTNRNTGGNQGHGGLLANTFRVSSSIGKTWFKVVAATKVTYDESTRTLSWDGQILTPGKIGSSTRVILDAGSIVIPNSTYEVVYLDLSRAATTQTTSPANAIRVGRYLDTSGEQYTGAEYQIPLFQRQSAGVYEVSPGFLPVQILSTPASSGDPLKVGFVKSSVDTANIFVKGVGPNNWIEYLFKRTVVAFDAGATANSQSDHWRLQDAYETNGAFTRQQGGNPIISAGEWACAIRENGSADYSGGYHGDELQTNSFFLLDGVRYAQDAIVSIDCDRMQFVQESTIYRCNTTTPIASRIVIYTFTANGIEIANDITWLASIVTKEAYLAMLPIKRQLLDTSGALITDSAIRFPGYAVEDVSTTGFTRTYTAAGTGSVVNLYGSVGISASVEILETPEIATATIDISNLAPYNKVYFNAVGLNVNYTTTIGERWKSKARYLITTRN